MSAPKKRDSVFHPEMIEDLHYWVTQDKRLALRILELVEAVMRDPFTGIGKPEPLKYQMQNTWSRRINHEHRLVYCVKETRIEFLQARYHYT